MPIDTTVRSDAPELMDDFALAGETLRDALDKIASINKILGGNNVTIDGVKQLIQAIPKDTEIHILDVGCGNGDMLRVLADYAIAHQLNFKLVGIDANQYTVTYAQKLSETYKNISYLCHDIFDEKLNTIKYDIILCTLTLHHFKDNEILTLLKSFDRNTKLGIVINDLHRSKLAYHSFQGLCFIFNLNDMSREDGLVSILRGFKKSDLLKYAKELKQNNYSLKWKWAFRYQWIIKKA